MEIIILKVHSSLAIVIETYLNWFLKLFCYKVAKQSTLNKQQLLQLLNLDEKTIDKIKINTHTK